MRGCEHSPSASDYDKHPPPLGRVVGRYITAESLWNTDCEQLKRHLSVFDDTSFCCTVARIVGEGGHIDTCLEIELTQVNRIVRLWALCLNMYTNFSKPLFAILVRTKMSKT